MKWQEWRERADDERLWLDHEERGLSKAAHLHDYVLRLWFDDIPIPSVYVLDFSPLIVDDNPGGVFLALKKVKRFQNVVGDYALIWPNPTTGAHDTESIDLAPECVRFFCERYGTKEDAGVAAIVNH